MTRNQQKAVELAQGIIDRKVVPIDLRDLEWQLLLLAAGLNSLSSLPLLVAHRVLQNSTSFAGYFGRESSRRGAQRSMAI
jgi:hypothetical protein